MKLVKYSLIALLTLISSCSHWTKVEYQSPNSQNFTSAKIEKERPIALFKGLTVYSGNTEVNPNRDFEERFIRKLRESDLFSEVIKDLSKSGKTVTLSLTTKENRDPHNAAAATKGFFIGLSLFVLTPVLPLKYDFDSSMKLEAKRWDGKSKVFEAESGGYAKFHLFANAAQAGQEIEGTVTANNINSILNQMVDNRDYFLGK